METHIFALILCHLWTANFTEALSAGSKSSISTGTRQISAFNLGAPVSAMGTGSSVSSSNSGGCPPLPSNCNYDCLSIGQDGCVQCTCTKQGSTGTGSLTAGSTLTSSGSGNQASTGAWSLTGGSSLSSSGAGNYNSSALSGGPFPVSGSGGIAGIFGNSTAQGGSFLPGSPGTLYGGNNTSGKGNTGMGSLTGGSTLTSSGTNITANSGSLANFFSGKLGTTMTGNNSFSSTGNVFNMGSSSGNQGNVAQASMNNNGCPSFPSNCMSMCVTLDRMGCPICTCTTSGNNSSSPSTSSQSFGSSLSGQTSASASQNLNGCPAFTNNCTAECVSLNSAGCPICTCHDAGSHSSQSSAHGSSANANGCPTFYSTCPASCVTLDGRGCPMCTCNATAGSGSASGSQSSGASQSHGSSQNNNGCPPFPTNCRGECASLDSRTGCPICTCTSASGNVSNPFSGGSTYQNPYNRPGPGNAQLANGCPQFPSNCPGSCTTINDQGCPVCTCTVPAVTTSECPPMPANCHTTCLWEDSESCIRCNGDCNENRTSSSSPFSSTTSSGGIQTTAKPTTGTPTCPSLDQNCPMNCVSLDNQGCIVCACAATTTTPTTTSAIPTVKSTTSQVRICPAFDGSNCRVECLAMDVKGCLICNCGTSAPTSAPPVVKTTSGNVATTQSSGSGSVTTFAPTMPTGSGTVSPNGCPQFDPSCAVECAAVDAMGCLTCSCPRNNTSTTGNGSGATGPNVGGAGKNNGCPVFDTSCAPGCAVIDAMGCLHCTCSGTTVTPGSGSGTGSSGSGGFPGSGSSGFPGSGSGGSSGSGSGGFPGGFPGSGSGGSSGSGSGGFPGSGSGGFPGSGSGGSCPAVDVMACQPSCLIYQNGCVLCTCPGTSTPATTFTTQPTGSTVPPVKEITMVPATTVTTQLTGSTVPPVKEITMVTNNPLGLLSTTNKCPVFDPSCSARCTSVDARGCPQCVCPATTTAMKPTTVTMTTTSSTTQRLTTQAHTAMTSRAPQTTSYAPGVCPPIRCLYPCDLGVLLGSDNCPVCKCRTNTTTARP